MRNKEGLKGEVMEEGNTAMGEAIEKPNPLAEGFPTLLLEKVPKTLHGK